MCSCNIITKLVCEISCSHLNVMKTHVYFLILASTRKLHLCLCGICFNAVLIGRLQISVFLVIFMKVTIILLAVEKSQ